MISLPIQWMGSMDSDVKTVMVEIDSDNRLRIIAGDIPQDTEMLTIQTVVNSNEYCRRI